MILAIDPGNIESGYVFLNNDLSVRECGKIDNEELLSKIFKGHFIHYERILDQYPQPTNVDTNVAIEMVACYGMPVGAEVFDTCVWIGRFKQALIVSDTTSNIQYIYRKEEKINLCGSMKAKDSNITQALIDRFAPGVRNKGKGTKKEPGWFYGFKKDIWQAYAVAVTFRDMYLGNIHENPELLEGEE